MSNVCKKCGKTLAKNSLKCKACGFDNSNSGASDNKGASAMSARDRAQAIAADVGGIGIYCREYGNSPDGFGVLSEGVLDISTGTECFDRIVWSDLNFGIGTSSKRPRKIEIVCTYKGSRGTMGVDVDLTDMVSPYNLGVKITEDLRLHFYIGTEGNSIEYVFKFLPEEIYSD